MNNTDVAHRWANGHEAKGSNFTSERGQVNTLNLYSYSTIIAQRRETDNGLVFIVSPVTYSPSTTKQQWYMKRAMSRGASIVFAIPDKEESTRLWYSNKINTLLDAFVAARKPLIYVAQAENLIVDLNAIQDILGWDVSALLSLLYPLLTPDAVAAAKEEQASREKRVIERNALLIEQWRAGEVGSGSLPSLPNTLLRVHRNRVETSLAISMKIEDAIEQYRIVMMLKRKLSFPAGSEVFGYQLKSVTEQAITIGCHVLTWDEIEACHNQLIKLV